MSFFGDIWHGVESAGRWVGNQAEKGISYVNDHSVDWSKTATEFGATVITGGAAAPVLLNDLKDKAVDAVKDYGRDKIQEGITAAGSYVANQLGVAGPSNADYYTPPFSGQPGGQTVFVPGSGDTLIDQIIRQARGGGSYQDAISTIKDFHGQSYPASEQPSASLGGVPMGDSAGFGPLLALGLLGALLVTS